jgi:hypothetical protein
MQQAAAPLPVAKSRKIWFLNGTARSLTPTREAYFLVLMLTGFAALIALLWVKA